MHAAFLSLAALLLLGGCAADPPAVPPSELVPIEPSVTLARRWSADAGEAGRGRFEPWLDEARVVAADGEGRVTAFDRRSGRRLWTRELGDTLASGVGGGDGTLYVGGADGTVHALSNEDGQTLWTASMSSEVLVPPVAAFGAVLVRSVDGRIVALEPADGSERWSVSNTPPALTLTGYGQPTLVAGGVLVGLDDGRLLALELASGRLIWESVLSVPSGRSEVERLVDVDADLVVDDQGIYVANYQGRAARLEPARGQVVWSVPMSSVAGLTIAGERVIVVDEEDGVHALERGSGRALWTSEALRGRRLSPPAVLPGGETIAVGDLEGYVHVLSLEDGALAGRARPARERIASRPLVDDGHVFVLGRDGRLSAHDIVGR